jgi:hypothetical protein
MFGVGGVGSDRIALLQYNRWLIQQHWLGLPVLLIDKGWVQMHSSLKFLTRDKTFNLVTCDTRG